MLEIQRIRAEKDALVKGLLKRNIHAETTLDEILAKDEAWRAAKTEMDTIAAEIDHGRANVMPFDVLLHQGPFVTERPFPVG
jgi:seryl-tRNA synthetase